MAEETKEQESQSQQEETSDTGTLASSETKDQTEAATTTATEKPKDTKGGEDYETRYKDLQAEHAKVSDEAAKNERLLETLQPYVDFERMNSERSGEAAGLGEGEEGEETFVTKKELADHKVAVQRMITTNAFQQKFRGDYPDLGDEGPREEMVRYFFENKTLKKDSFEKRMESAVKSTRDLLKTEQVKGEKTLKETQEKEAKETKRKSEEAAAASGLGSAGTTSPKTSEEKPETTTGFIDRRRERKTQQKNLT